MRSTIVLDLIRSLLLVVICALSLAGPSRADEAGVRRLTAALTRVDDAPEPLSAMFTEMRGLEGLRLDDSDAAFARELLGAKQQAFLPIIDALRSLTVEGGVVRLMLERPVAVSVKKGALALARETSFRVRSGPQGELIVDECKGIKVGRSPSLTLPLRTLRVVDEDGKRVSYAEVMLGFIRKTFRFDRSEPASEPASGPGLVGALTSTN